MDLCILDWRSPISPIFVRKFWVNIIVSVYVGGIFALHSFHPGHLVNQQDLMKYQSKMMHAVAFIWLFVIIVGPMAAGRDRSLSWGRRAAVAFCLHTQRTLSALYGTPLGGIAMWFHEAKSQLKSRSRTTKRGIVNWILVLYHVSVYSDK